MTWIARRVLRKWLREQESLSRRAAASCSYDGKHLLAWFHDGQAQAFKAVREA